MPSEKEILMIQKATMFDFKQILEANPDKTYTVEELKHLIDTYIAGAGQKTQGAGKSRLFLKVAEP